MASTSEGDEATDQFFALLNSQAIDPSLDSTPSSTSFSPTPVDVSSSRPVTFSSAFSQSSRPRRSSALAASHNITRSYSNPLSSASSESQTLQPFPEYNFLTNTTTEREEDGAIAGPGPSSIASLVARNGNAIQGLEHFDPSLDPSSAELPIPPPLPQATPTSHSSESTPKLSEPKKRGRPRTKPQKDPNQPAKKRGRPKKHADRDETPRTQEDESTYFPDVAPGETRSGAEESEDEEGDGSDSTQRSRGSQKDGDETRKEKRKKKKKPKGRKRIEPPLIPRVFRSPKKVQETNEETADLDVHDLLEGKVRELEEGEELTEEQMRELQRAMNPNFAPELLAMLEEHAEQYNRAYKALQEELLAVQVEESYLEHIKEVALEMRNNIRYPLKTVDEIEQLESNP
ncbi:uncharacterized protein JCM6883_005571 [Sporobolomyces salmoneus]|uniref:uncharacterized protein n=1 Tax=Sporobolomyces salmoneus TaxID=183962 RepID=UPI00317B6E8B